jgi:hypothetical protein
MLAAEHLTRLLWLGGHAVTHAELFDGHGLRLAFDHGHALTVIDDTERYEAAQISIPLTTGYLEARHPHSGAEVAAPASQFRKGTTGAARRTVVGSKAVHQHVAPATTATSTSPTCRGKDGTPASRTDADGCMQRFASRLLVAEPKASVPISVPAGNRRRRPFPYGDSRRRCPTPSALHATRELCPELCPRLVGTNTIQLRNSCSTPTLSSPT